MSALTDRQTLEANNSVEIVLTQRCTKREEHPELRSVFKTAKMQPNLEIKSPIPNKW